MHSASRFMRKTLMPDEVIAMDARFHYIYSVTAWLALAGFAALGYSLQYALYHYTRIDTYAPLAAGAFLGAWVCFWMLLKKWTTEIVLTNHRLIHKTGFFLIDVHEVDIEQLASHHVVQSLLGRLLDYGEVHVRCIEATDIFLPPISHPYAFRNAMEQEKHHYRNDYMKVERLRHHGVGDR